MAKQQKNSLEAQIHTLESLLQNLQQISALADKLKFINTIPQVIQGWDSFPTLKAVVKEYPIQHQYVVTLMLAIGQGSSVFADSDHCDQSGKQLDLLIEKLLEVEKFYDSIGGIIGYHLTMLKLIATAKDVSEPLSGGSSYKKPDGLDVSQNTLEVRQAVRWGVEALRQTGIIYPLGGAGDRLHLQDEETGDLLPAAQLSFCGYTLLEGLIRDLQGWEFLYYKIFGKQLITPIAMMTSHEKKNDARVRRLCEEKKWFGRGVDNFRFFIQPLVPMMTADGEWVINGPLEPMLKPGGHGAMWKTAIDSGIFDWFERLQKKQVIVRQINNPMAGVDNGLIALAGIGDHYHKAFGFASCQRLLKAPEGMNVLKEVKMSDGNYEYGITNIEYTDFTRHGIEDSPAESESSAGKIYSMFPSNTNILFAHLEAVKQALKICPLPGILVNMKSQVACWHTDGKITEKPAGRLESTMQNIADYITDRLPHPLTATEENTLRTFLIYNERRKTISVVKKAYTSGESLNGTPEGCFFEQTENYRDLLTNHCGMALPAGLQENEPPNFTALFHPALGILYSVICQKIRRGRIEYGSDWVIEASEVNIENLHLAGRLVIEADAVTGKKDGRGMTIYDSESCGKCTLLNVTVKNQGKNRSGWRDVWQNITSESLHIVLHGNAEFFAEDVEFSGDVHYDVPDGHRLVVYQQGDETAWHFEQIRQASWKWDYTFDAEEHICLEKI
ncbi:MAG: hypothetical protein WCF65_05415 [Parachlamydiaceae bacterium]